MSSAGLFAITRRARGVRGLRDVGSDVLPGGRRTGRPLRLREQPLLQDTGTPARLGPQERRRSGAFVAAREPRAPSRAVPGPRRGHQPSASGVVRRPPTTCSSPAWPARSATANPRHPRHRGDEPAGHRQGPHDLRRPPGDPGAHGPAARRERGPSSTTTCSAPTTPRPASGRRGGRTQDPLRMPQTGHRTGAAGDARRHRIDLAGIRHGGRHGS